MITSVANISLGPEPNNIVNQSFNYLPGAVRVNLSLKFKKNSPEGEGVAQLLADYFKNTYERESWVVGALQGDFDSPNALAARTVSAGAVRISVNYATEERNEKFVSADSKLETIVTLSLDIAGHTPIIARDISNLTGLLSTHCGIKLLQSEDENYQLSVIQDGKTISFADAQKLLVSDNKTNLVGQYDASEVSANGISSLKGWYFEAGTARFYSFVDRLVKKGLKKFEAIETAKEYIRKITASVQEVDNVKYPS